MPPKLVIEIVSPGQTMQEFENKTKYYFNAGVLRVWIVDLEGISITVFYPNGKSQLYTSETKLIDTLLPGLELSTEQVFEKAELI